jgi:hypothetical protein
MAQQVIDNGTVAGDGTGEPLFDAFAKANANFDELYARAVPTNTLKGARVRVATTTDVNLVSPGANLDDVAMVANDTFLATGQTAASQNGVWVWNGAATACTRAPAFDVWDEIVGAIFTTSEGTANAGKIWFCFVGAGGTLGSTAVTIKKLVGKNSGVWTPAIKFGGASVGIAETNSGEWTEVDGMALYTGLVSTTAKGSSTGAFSITGLAHTALANCGVALAYFSGLTGVTTQLTGYVTNGGTSITFYKGGATGLLDADLGDAINLQFSFTIPIAS